MIPHIDKNGEACIIVAINKEARAKAAKIMGTVSLGNKAIKGVAKVREANNAFNQQEAAKRSNKGKMSKSDFGMSPQERAPNAISKMQQSFPRRDRFEASGGFDRVSEKLGDRDFKSLKNLRLRG